MYLIHYSTAHRTVSLLIRLHFTETIKGYTLYKFVEADVRVDTLMNSNCN